MGQFDLIKIRHINYFFAIAGGGCALDAAAQLHDGYFLFLNVVAMMAGYFTGIRWLDGNQELTMDRAMRVFWLPLVFLVLQSLILIAGPQPIRHFNWLFIAQSVLAGRRLKSQTRAG